MATHCNQGTERLGNKACEVAGSTDMSDTAQPVTSVRTFDCNATQLLLLHLVGRSSPLEICLVRMECTHM